MKTIISVLFFIEFIFSVLLLTPHLIYMLVKRKKMTEREQVERTYRVGSKWIRRQLKLARVRIETRGMENIPDIPAVYIGNHQSFVDIAALLAIDPHPKGFIAKFEMSHIPIFGTLMLFMKCVFIDRNDIRQSAKAINTGIGYVKDGYSMVIYPEGTRSRKRDMLDWKPGAFKLATKSGAPIVPITSFDTFKVLEQNNYRIKGHRIVVVFHEPIPTANLSREEQVNMPERVKAIIQKQIDALSKEFPE